MKGVFGIFRNRYLKVYRRYYFSNVVVMVEIKEVFVIGNCLFLMMCFDISGKRFVWFIYGYNCFIIKILYVCKFFVFDSYVF